MNPARGPATTQRSPQLDGLRGIAILMVFFHHSGVHLSHWWDWGQMGVRMFFVLTGYLITLSLWKISEKVGGDHPARELGVFHLKRFARLLPAFYLALLFGVVVGFEDVINPLLWHLSFLTNFKIAAQGYWFGPTAHFWSLALQEQFYLLWPFAVLFLPRRWFPWFLLLVFSSGYLYRVFCLQFGISEFYRWIMLPGSLDTFAIGGFLAWLKKGPGLPKLPREHPGLGFLFLLMAGLWFLNRYIRVGPTNPWVDGLPEVLEGIVAGYLLIGSVHGWRGVIGQILSWNPLRYIGRISYGIFVYHLLLLFFCEPYLSRYGVGPDGAAWPWALLMLGVTILVSALSWHFIEQPTSKAANRFWERKAKEAGKKTPAAP